MWQPRLLTSRLIHAGPCLEMLLCRFLLYTWLANEGLCLWRSKPNTGSRPVVTPVKPGPTRSFPCAGCVDVNDTVCLCGRGSLDFCLDQSLCVLWWSAKPAQPSSGQHDLTFDMSGLHRCESDAGSNLPVSASRNQQLPSAFRWRWRRW